MNGDKTSSLENSREITDFQNLTINFDEIKLSENELKLLEKQNSRIVADFKGILYYYIYIHSFCNLIIDLDRYKSKPVFCYMWLSLWVIQWGILGVKLLNKTINAIYPNGFTNILNKGLLDCVTNDTKIIYIYKMYFY